MTAYEFFGVTPDVSIDEIRKLYKRKAMQLHPDRPGGSHEKFQELTRAYEIIVRLKTKCQRCGGTGEVVLKVGYGRVKVPCPSCMRKQS